MFPTGSINYSWVTAKLSRDITGFYAVNCYIRKQILYFPRLIIDEQRKVSLENRLIYASMEAVTLAETIVMQMNTRRNTVLTLNRCSLRAGSLEGGRRACKDPYNIRVHASAIWTQSPNWLIMKILRN